MSGRLWSILWHALEHGRQRSTRDQTWKISQPKYRLQFHEVNGAADEYEVDWADIAGIMAWAEAQLDGRTFVLYACVPYDGLGLPPGGQ